MTSSSVVDAPVVSKTNTSARRSFLLVFSCTLIGALAQLFIKQGTAEMGAHITLVDLAHHPDLFVSFCLGVLRNFKLVIGYSFYGINVFLLALALKGRELSRLYPIIALTYVWVTLISLVLLHEHMNFFRAMGIAFIVGGVSVLGLRK